MADNKSKMDGRDDSKVNRNQPYEVAQLAKTLHVTKQTVIDAQKTVGPSRPKVVEYIKKHK